MAKPKRGRHPDFTYQQNQALRVVLSEVTENSSQKAVGEALGIAQQNVGRLLNDRKAGFAHSTAKALVRLAGFASVDAFLDAKGLSDVAKAS